MTGAAKNFDGAMTMISDAVVDRMIDAVPELAMVYRKRESLRYWLADNVLEGLTVADTRKLVRALESER